MRLTGNSDPATGKKEYDTGDGTTVYMTDDEFTNTFGVAPSMRVEPTDYTPTELNVPETPAAILPQTSISPPADANARMMGYMGTTSPSPTITTTPPAALPVITSPASVGSSGVKYLDDEGGLHVDKKTIENPSIPAITQLKETTTTARPMSPELQKAQDNAFKKEGMAIASGAEAEIALNNAATLEAQATAQREAKFLEEEAARQQREQDATNERQAKLDAISAEYNDMTLDSNRLWNNKSTGDKILAAIAIGLGAMGQAQSGGENHALNLIQGTIDRDIEEQKHNIAKAGNNVSTQRGLFSDVLRRTGDERLARLKTHEMGLKAVGGQYLQLKAQANNDFTRAKADRGLALVQQGLVKNQVDQAASITSKVSDIAPPKAAEGTRYEQGTGEKLSSLVQSIKEFDGLEKVLKEGGGDEIGPIVGRYNDLKTKFGLPVSKEFTDVRTRSKLIYLVTKKFYTGLGSGVKENLEFQGLVPNENDTETVALNKLKELRTMAKQQYAEAYGQEAGRYKNPKAISESFPDPRLLDQNTFGFTAQPEGK